MSTISSMLKKWRFNSSEHATACEACLALQGSPLALINYQWISMLENQRSVNIASTCQCEWYL